MTIFHCNFCNKSFKSHSSKCRHQSKYCKIKKEIHFEDPIVSTHKKIIALENKIDSITTTILEKINLLETKMNNLL